MADGEALDQIALPCGNTAYYDHNRGSGYVCENCMCVVGGIGEPQACRDSREKYDTFKLLGSKIRWNYLTGNEVEVDAE